MNNAVRYQVTPLDFYAKKRLAEESIRSNWFHSDRKHAVNAGIDPKTAKAIRENMGEPSRQERIRGFVGQNYHLSDREISRITGVSRNTVSKYRKEAMGNA